MPRMENRIGMPGQTMSRAVETAVVYSEEVSGSLLYGAPGQTLGANPENVMKYSTLHMGTYYC